MKQIILGENRRESQLRLNSTCFPDPQTAACYSFKKSLAMQESQLFCQWKSLLKVKLEVKLDASDF